MSESRSERLQRMLSDQGMTQADLAAALRVSKATVSGWCSGNRTPTRDNTAEIARVLGTTAMYLEYGHSEPGEGSTDAALLEARQRYLDETGWYFRAAPRDGGRELGNAAAFAFSPSIVTLARETGQNSSDEILLGETTVRMRFTVMELTDQHLSKFLDALRFSEIRPHLVDAADAGQKAGAVIASGLRQLEEEGRLLLVRIEDYNASGLTGEEYERGRFLAVARNTLDSFKGDQAGGSFGLGKAAMWACSQFGLVLLNSTLSEPDSAGQRVGRFIGRMEVPWHETAEESFAGPAWIGHLNSTQVAESYWNNPALLGDLYLERADAAPGTSFLIVGAFDPSGEATTADEIHDALAEAMATNFWAAMVETGEEQPERLRVAVVTERNGVRIREDIVDPSRYDSVRGKVEMLRRYRLDLTSEDLSDEDTVVVKSVALQVPKRTAHGSEHEAIAHDAVLLVASAEDGEPDAKVVSYMRGSLMTIMEQTIRGLPLGSVPFRAVVLAGNAAGTGPGERAAERFLRAAENPEHNKWEGTTDLTTGYAIGAKTRLKEFFDEVRNSIKEVVSRQSTDESDGPEALKELLRIAPPKTETDRRPRVWEATGGPNEAGAWEVEAVVSLPARDEPWQFTPVLRYGTESGPTIPVQWAEVVPVAKCRLDAGRIVSDPRSRRVRFKAVSDPSSHPVGATRAKVLVDVRVYTGSGT